MGGAVPSRGNSTIICTPTNTTTTTAAAVGPEQGHAKGAPGLGGRFHKPRQKKKKKKPKREKRKVGFITLWSV